MANPPIITDRLTTAKRVGKDLVSSRNRPEIATRFADGTQASTAARPTRLRSSSPIGGLPGPLPLVSHELRARSP